jgi:hypothetical protein
MGSPERLQHSRAKSEPGVQTEHADHPPLPAAPNPSADPGVVPSITTPPEDEGIIPDEIDIFVLSPVAALKMLCGSVEALVKVTGDIPPTPPVHLFDTPTVQTIVAEKEELARTQTSRPIHRARFGTPESRSMSDNIDGVPFTKTPIGSPEAHASESLHIVGAGAEPIYLQHGAIARRFYSKKPPSISLEEYLLRLHRYCPMSTAVYLATSLYINKLAVLERALPVTPRNVHRLVLAGLRVAMKALEDLSYPHRRFAKVGGVSEAELGRLEISFCFLTNFELKVDAEMLLKEAEGLRDGASIVEAPQQFQPRLPPLRDKRKSAPSMMQQVLPTRSSFVETLS